MSAAPERYVTTASIREAVRGHEDRVLDQLGIRWRDGRTHITCPYPAHGGQADWRWDAKAAKAHCTCRQGDGIFDVVMNCEGLAFDSAKLRVAEIIGRHDLIREKAGDAKRYQKSDAASLLNPNSDNREDELVRAYLAHRLGISRTDVLMPSTPIAGLKALGYFDPPPAGRAGKPTLLGEFPCAVFGTIAADGGQHAHRIYLGPAGAGKAELEPLPNGRQRDPKKSARTAEGNNTAGRAALWGDPAIAPWIILAEGIETAAAVAQAFRPEIEANEAVVAAAISAGGIEAFQPRPATRRVTVAADRDERARPGKPSPSRRGEQAARAFGLAHHSAVQVDIALPGSVGEAADWLDVLRAGGVEAVRTGVASAQTFVPTTEELEARERRTERLSEVERIARLYPLPNLDTLKLEYACASSGKVKVHKAEVTRKTGDVVMTPVATPFGMPARLRFIDQSDAYGLRVVVEDMGAQRREIDVDRASLARMGAADIRSLLFGAGLRTEGDGEQIAVLCLKAADPASEILVVRKPGWHAIPGLPDPVFVCPDGRVLGAPQDTTLELLSSVRVSPVIGRAGTLDGWKSAVAEALGVTGCEHWGLGVIAAFAAPLISLTHLDTCGLSLSGLSSSGKTTAQRLAVSAWSKPAVHKDSLFQSARATVNSMEAVAARSNGTVLVLDELAHLPGKELGRLIYMLAGGVGKRRMTSDAALREGYTWSTFVLLSAESSLEEKIRSDGGDWTAGMTVRVGDVDVTGVNRNVDRAILAGIGAIDEHFGHAGPAFVQGLIESGLHSKAQDLRTGILDLATRLAGPGADSALNRAAVPFAILSMAGELAREFDLLPKDADVPRIVRWAWNRYRQSGDAQALDPQTQAVTNIQTWIAERWDSSIQQVEAEKIYRDAVGWYDDDAVYLPTERLRDAAGGGLKEIEVARALDTRDLLAKRKDAECRFVAYVPKVGKVKAYALRRSEFGRSGVGHGAAGYAVHSGGRS